MLAMGMTQIFLVGEVWGIYVCVCPGTQCGTSLRYQDILCILTLLTYLIKARLASQYPKRNKLLYNLTMPSFIPLLPILSLLSLSANARPTTSPIAIAETWSIPRLTMHMMTPTTGLPGNGAWPPSLRFNSTIDFDIMVPDHSAVVSETEALLKMNCMAIWENGTLPEGRIGCTSAAAKEGQNKVDFEMNLYTGLEGRRPELSFILNIWRDRKLPFEFVAFGLGGSIPITANDPTEPSSYLTCLGGAPLDGLRCNIGSYLSVRKELIIQGS
ncbi:hypothetical protein GMOD_00005511 [Pyrenophora seminiperda CCB06]|uniref:Uncharacterized protein n=1 Tax=Pyrenophora seminiperda CCB06 TaxID=1302712 RepID=A0A3M7M9A0_9PLEO|nr:hypothetical protein GMOD_00005511 [Pyrenophora seminiperda CCB06]